MYRFRKAVISLALLALGGVALAQSGAKITGLGRDATPKEVAAWDIDVRPDFKGLPVGSGTVAQGQDVWEGKCASCHGFFGESGEVFSPIIGGVQPKDMETGHVANLTTPGYPGRTTFMKVASISTVWDFINRAMPWNAPKTLKTDEVYAVLAFMLNIATIVPDDFTLNEKTIREVQKRMPNRNGMTTDHALWPGKEFGGARKPDTSNVACMKDCTPEPKLASFLPDFARNAHGNLAEQNRLVGAQHGADTTQPEAKAGDKPALPAAPKPQAEAPAPGADAGKPDAKKALALLQKNGCLICHGMSNKIVGPAYSDVAKKYAGQVDYLAAKIKSGGAGVWGPIPMPAQALSTADAKTIAVWLAAGAGK
ncbi:MAG: c-type cytochrome [Rhodoferax sp.]|nr:c-type cytochrome [Rhodoferax sp.]